MVTEFTSYEVDNDKRFRNAIDRALLVTQDLRIPLTLISKDWFKSNRAIFQLKGPGQYPDLGGFKPLQKIGNKTRQEIAKDRKKKAFGFVYPLLEGKGRLSGSITQPTHGDAINQIINKVGLVIGTKVPYGVYHQSDDPRRKLPLRKFVFIGPEAPISASNKELSGRPERWLNTLNSFVIEKLQREMGS